MFNTNSNKSQLSNERTNNWKNLSVNLKIFETSNEHIANMNFWVESKVKLLKNKTIDRDFQEKINMGRDHWKKY